MEFYGSVQLYYELKAFLFRPVFVLGGGKSFLEHFITVRLKRIRARIFVVFLKSSLYTVNFASNVTMHVYAHTNANTHMHITTCVNTHGCL